MNQAPGSPCLDDGTVLRFVSGTSPPGEGERVLGHLDQCAACLELIVQAASAARLPDLTASAGSSAEPAQIDEFVLLQPLGQGASGRVYLALDTCLQRRVALKLLLEPPSAAARERFLTEARALARLRHPNVVGVHRTGEWAGRPYLITELLRGASLAQVELPLPPVQVLAYARDLARGLAAAHEAGVLHRDLKRSNIMVTSEGLKLLDFGLAQLGAAAGGAGLVGTPLYMAPEQWREEPATPRSDVYALGAVLYELCSGQLPHRAASLAELRERVLTEDAPPLERGPEPLRRLIERCLSRDPARRPADGGEVLALLERVALGRPLRRLVWPVLMLVGLGGLGGLGLWLRGRPAQVRIPGGVFWMGSDSRDVRAALSFCQRLGIQCAEDIYQREGPRRRVLVSPFHLDTTEVTNRRYAAWLAKNPRLQIERERLVFESGEPSGAGRVLLADLYPGTEYSGLVVRQGMVAVRQGFAQRPVVQVTWEGAARYCRDQGQRLPTEAEWELAAQGLAGARFPWGDEPPRCEGVVFGRVAGKACAAQPLGPAEVASAAQDRSAQGVHDLGGNVAEWVADVFLPRYRECPEPCRDPVERDGGAGEPLYRVVRGGAWYRAAEATRATGRARARWDQVFGDIGFRCAR